jgi:uncharacterized Zn-finger protein
MFSMFFIISYNTAHQIVAYGAIAGGVGIGVAALIMGLRRRHKVSLSDEVENDSEVPNRTPSRVKLISSAVSMKDSAMPIRAPTSVSFGMSGSTEKVAEQKSVPKPIVHMVIQMKNGSEGGRIQMDGTPNKMAPTMTTPKIETEAVAPMASSVDKGKITCYACKKEFSTPLIMIDYSEPKAKLVSYCPYCNQPLTAQQDSLAKEDVWKKYVKNGA